MQGFSDGFKGLYSYRIEFVHDPFLEGYGRTKLVIFWGAALSFIKRGLYFSYILLAKHHRQLENI